MAERLGMEWVDSDSRKKLETQIARRVFRSSMMELVIMNQENLLLKALFL